MKKLKKKIYQSKSKKKRNKKYKSLNYYELNKLAFEIQRNQLETMLRDLYERVIENENQK